MVYDVVTDVSIIVLSGLVTVMVVHDVEASGVTVDVVDLRYTWLVLEYSGQNGRYVLGDGWDAQERAAEGGCRWQSAGDRQDVRVGYTEVDGWRSCDHSHTSDEQGGA